MEKDNTDFKERIRKDLMDAPKEMVVNLLLDMNFRPNDISQIAIILCEAWDGCKNCPCVWDNADKRTEEECYNGYTCQEQLWNWIKEKVKESIENDE